MCYNTKKYAVKYIGPMPAERCGVLQNSLRAAMVGQIFDEMGYCQMHRNWRVENQNTGYSFIWSIWVDGRLIAEGEGDTIKICEISSTTKELFMTNPNFKWIGELEEPIDPYWRRR